jgi:regulator of nucleoside diphosphate kinase
MQPRHCWAGDDASIEGRPFTLCQWPRRRDRPTLTTKLTMLRPAKKKSHNQGGKNHMKRRTIYITEFDMKRLQELIDEAKRLDRLGNEYLESLEAELSRGELVASTDVPPDVITMNSRVRLVDLDTKEELVYTLVFPNAADIAESRISVLAPIGTAMLGYRVGDTFAWSVPDGIRTLQVKEVIYQPEASGDYHL